ncbi:hypothetical protein ACP179_00580 (plasmid) [Xenorhabdus stockiae]
MTITAGKDLKIERKRGHTTGEVLITTENMKLLAGDNITTHGHVFAKNNIEMIANKAIKSYSLHANNIALNSENILLLDKVDAKHNVSVTTDRLSYSELKGENVELHFPQRSFEGHPNDINNI